MQAIQPTKSTKSPLLALILIGSLYALPTLAAGVGVGVSGGASVNAPGVDASGGVNATTSGSVTPPSVPATPAVPAVPANKIQKNKQYNSDTSVNSDTRLKGKDCDMRASSNDPTKNC